MTETKPHGAEADVRAREELILGKPPRIAPLPTDEISQEALENVTALRKAASGAPPTLADVPELVTTLLRHPELYQCITAMGVQLLGRSTLTVRDRELAVLRVAWLCQAPYEWGEHVLLGKRMGLTSDDVTRVTCGSSSPGWDTHERAILRAVEELHADAMISDATWETLAQRLDETQLIELPVLIGAYTAVAYWQNAFRLRLAPGNAGLAAR